MTAEKKKREPTAEAVAARELVRQARAQGLSLTGPDGLLKQFQKSVIEAALAEEMTEHLGQAKHGDQPGRAAQAVPEERDRGRARGGDDRASGSCQTWRSGRGQHP